MSSSQSRVDQDNAKAAEALLNLANVIDGERLAPHPGAMDHLTVLPVAPGRFHAHWELNPQMIQEGRNMLGVDSNGAKLVLRAYDFRDHGSNYAAAESSSDYPIHGLCNSGYFDLESTPAHVGAVLGLKNDQGHFRPLMRAETVALPQPVAKPAPEVEPKPAHEPSPVRQTAPEVALSPLDEQGIVARLPRLDNLPAELLKTPDELAFFDREPDASVVEAEIVPLTGKLILDESTIHEAIISGNCRVLSEPKAKATAADTPAAAKSAGLPENVGASELFASQWADSWDDNAPISLRAELTINGRLGPGMKLAIGSQAIKPLPGGYFKITRKLSGFAEVWPLFLTASLSEPDSDYSLELAKDATTGETMLELHASIAIEGRINDESYRKLLPPGVSTDAQGRFELHRALPNGALLLPGLSLIAEA